MLSPWWQYAGNRQRILASYVRNPNAKNKETLIKMLEWIAKGSNVEPAPYIVNAKEHVHAWVQYFEEKGSLDCAKAKAILIRLRSL